MCFGNADAVDTQICEFRWNRVLRERTFATVIIVSSERTFYCVFDQLRDRRRFDWKLRKNCVRHSEFRYGHCKSSKTKSNRRLQVLSHWAEMVLYKTCTPGIWRDASGVNSICICLYSDVPRQHNIIQRYIYRKQEIGEFSSTILHKWRHYKN